jgi:histidine ammonia-lyase
VHGAALDALEHLEQVLAIEMNSSPENPLVDPESDDVFHNGNFHAIYVGLALDGVRLGTYNTAALSVSRISALMEPGLTKLRPFLASGPEASSGLLITEYIAQSALAELRHLANPDSLGGAVVSRGTEEHASFATQSAWHTSSFEAAYETVLACELVAAVRALRQQGGILEAGPLHDVYAEVSVLLDPSTDDRSVEADVALARAYLKNL